MEHTSSQSDQAKVWELIKDAHTALLITVDEDGALQARPMGCLQKQFDGTLWFLTFRQSLKLRQIRDDDRVLVAYVKPEKYEYVAISGRAKIVEDKQKLKELWFEGLRVWFPKGPDDPELALLAIEVEKADYWADPASIVTYAFAYVKSQDNGTKSVARRNRRNPSQFASATAKVDNVRPLRGGSSSHLQASCCLLQSASGWRQVRAETRRSWVTNGSSALSRFRSSRSYLSLLSSRQCERQRRPTLSEQVLLPVSLRAEISAMAYSLHCTDNSLPFVAIWYGGTIVLCTVAGAAFGPRLLRWSPGITVSHPREPVTSHRCFPN